MVVINTVEQTNNSCYINLYTWLYSLITLVTSKVQFLGDLNLYTFLSKSVLKHAVY